MSIRDDGHPKTQVSVDRAGRTTKEKSP